MSREHVCGYQDPLTCMNSVMTWKRFPHYWPFMVAIRFSLKGSVMRSSIVCSTVDSGADQRKHQSSASLAFVRGTHRSPVNSPHKGPVTRKMFPFDDVIIPHTQAHTHTFMVHGTYQFNSSYIYIPIYSYKLFLLFLHYPGIFIEVQYGVGNILAFMCNQVSGHLEMKCAISCFISNHKMKIHMLQS